MRIRFFALTILLVNLLLLTSYAPKTMEPVKTGYALVNGINMYYEIHGKGDVPLVLIHGGGSTIESNWSNMLPLLAAKYKVIAVELQAHGRTNDRNAPKSFEQDADDVAALLKYLKIDKANILGFSNGGTTTLQLAIRHPEVVNKIIVISANYRRDGMIPRFFDGFPNAKLENMPQPLKDAYLKVNPSKEGLQNMFNKDVQRMINFKDIPDDSIRSIKARALLMVADHDVMTVEHVASLSHLINGSQLIVLPGTHGSFLGEVCSAKKGSKYPQITAELVEEFLGK